MPLQAWLITGTNAIQVLPITPVRVTTDGGGGADFASPYNAKPWDYVIPDTSRGSVVINLPTLSGRGTSVWIRHDSNTSLASNTVTVNGPTSPAVNIEQPSPNLGSFASSYQFPPPGTPSANLELYRGTRLAYFNGGSLGGYLLDSPP